jgi:hypothetical protein
MTVSATLPAEHGEANRNLTSISPFFIVKDLPASIAHYVERFGFQLDFQGPPDDVYYGHVSRDGIGIMLKAIAPGVLPCPNHTRGPRMGPLGCRRLRCSGPFSRLG